VGAPSGLVTLLFTDIEGSTRAWEAHPAEMQIALARHDAIVRAQIEDAGGHVFKTAGDAFCAAFTSPAQALGAAVNVQRALAAEPWPEPVPITVRIGIHSGVCHERDGDYFGPAVNRVARLHSTAYGGQVVISGTTAGLVAGALPADLSLRDLGEHRLKDLGEPEHVYQLCGAELSCDFPPLRSLDSSELSHNLPALTSSFVGREHEVDELRGLVADHRIVTLTGAGGVGKTRLALQVAADLVDGSGDGVWFVDLAPLQDPALVTATTASVLGVREEPGRSALESLAARLRSRTMLVVLDNCEHVIDEAARLVDTLARSCPRLAILATSREPLRVPGEHVYRVPSLSAPAKDEDDPDVLIGSEAVRLFLERAGDQQSGVSLDAQNAAVVARLCRRLDGIPLAIELAVARLRSLSLTDLDRQLDQRLRLLIGGSRTALPRHQTLEALIGWSYDMLSPIEQELLDRLSVFAGGFDLDAADAVVRSRTQSSLGILDRLAALVDKSLIETDRRAKLRYRLLESVRQYTAAKLLTRGEDVARGVRGAHRDYYMALAEAAAPHLIGHGQREWLDRLERELDNLRTALTYCLEDPDPSLGLRLNTALFNFWLYRRAGGEGPTAACAAVDRPDAQRPTVIRGRALVAAAHLLTSLALEDRAAASRAEEGLRIARAQADERLRCEALYVLAWANVRRDDDRVLEFTEEGLDLARLVGDEHLRAAFLNVRASSPSLMHHERVRLCEECLDLLSQVGDQVMYTRVLGNLAYLEIVSGEYQAARRRLNEAISMLRELDDARGLTVCLCNLGLSLLLDGMTAHAQITLDEMLCLSRRTGDLEMVAYGQLGLALLASRMGDCEGAAELHGAADAIHETLGTRVQEFEAQVRDADIAALRVKLGETSFEASYRLGRMRRADAMPAAA
jgi:predicted ATPase/class 3 adenylate cyclase